MRELQMGKSCGSDVVAHWCEVWCMVVHIEASQKYAFWITYSLDALFQVGQEIKVVISQVDEYNNRLSLSTKIFEEYPGEILEKFEQVMTTAEERLAAKAEQSEQ